MKRELRLGLLCLLIPIMIAAFYLESKMLLSTGAHTLVQVLILTGIYWLAWQWVRFDKFSNLREGSQSRHARYTYRVSYPIKDQIDIKNDQIKQRSGHFEKAPLDKQQVPVPNGKISLKKALSSRHPWLHSTRQNKN